MSRPKQINALSVLTMSDLVDRVSARTNYTKYNVRTVLSVLKEVVLTEVAQGNAVRLKNFGIFVPVLRYNRDPGTKKMWLNKNMIGMAFYPSRSVIQLQPKVDMNLLHERGEYAGHRHVYASK